MPYYYCDPAQPLPIRRRDAQRGCDLESARPGPINQAREPTPINYHSLPGGRGQTGLGICDRRPGEGQTVRPPDCPARPRHPRRPHRPRAQHAQARPRVACFLTSARHLQGSGLMAAHFRAAYTSALGSLHPFCGGAARRSLDGPWPLGTPGCPRPEARTRCSACDRRKQNKHTREGKKKHVAVPQEGSTFNQNK